MAITERTRKLLWGRSGNRCAVCRKELVVDATERDRESVIGEEAHIVSPKGEGPRSFEAYPDDQLDAYENRILLCRSDHKMVDDQVETYSVERLRTLKKDHETWVATTLEGSEQLQPIQLRRFKDKVPAYLSRVTSGSDLWQILEGAFGYEFSNDEPETSNEVELISGALQEMQDWGDLSSDFEAGRRVTTAVRLKELLGELEASGFWLFGTREVRQLEGGVGPPSPAPVAIIELRRLTSPDIIKVTLGTERTSADASSSGGPETYKVTARVPPETAEGDIEACIAIVKDGGAVDQMSAGTEILLASVLAVASAGTEVVGTGAIKRVRRGYAERVAHSSGDAFPSDVREMGYIAVKPDHQGKGLASRIVDELLVNYEGALFATTDNEYMKRTLLKCGFRRIGKEWVGHRGQLSLWLKP